MNYDVLLGESGSVDIHSMRSVSPGVNVGSAKPEISYPKGSITQAAIHLTRRYDKGEKSYWENRVVVTARMPEPHLVVQSFTFDTGAQAEEFYNALVEILGWT